MDDKAWLRRTGETNPAYEAFRTYMRVRSTSKVALELSKSDTLIKRWSSEHEWVSRIAAYDNYLATADTDGEINRIGQSRDKTLQITDELKSLLLMRLRHFAERGEDPTIRFTQALTAMAKVEQVWLLSRDDQKTAEKLDNVMALAQRALELQSRVPEGT